MTTVVLLAIGLGMAAVVEDLRCRRVPNWLTATGLAGGLGCAAWGGWHGLGTAAAGKGGASAHSRLRVRRAARAGVGNHDPAQVERDVELRSFLMRGARFSVPPWASAHGLTVIRRWRAEARHSTLKRAPRHALS